MACSLNLEIGNLEGMHKSTGIRYYQLGLQLGLKVHPACAILACYESEQAIKDSLPKLAVFLYEENLIGLMILPVNARDGSDQIFKKIQEAVCSDYRNLEKFASVLLKFPATREFGEAIIDDIREEFFDDEMCVSLDSVMTIVNQLQENEILVEVTECRIFAEIRCNFAEALLNASKAIGDLPYKDLKLYLRRGYPHLASHLDQCQNNNEIVSIISGECSLTDVNLLEAVAEKFKIEDAISIIKEYKQKVDQFCTNMPLNQYFIKLRSSKGPLFQPEMVTILVKCNTDSCAMDDAKTLISECASQHLAHFKVVFVQDSED